MQSINRVTLLGTVSKLPENGFNANNVESSVFTLCTTESYKAKDGAWKQMSTYHRVVAFKKEHIKLLGEQVKMDTALFVEGKVKTRKYQDKSGNERYITEIIIGMYDGVLEIMNNTLTANNNNVSFSPSNSNVAANTSSGLSLDDIPF